MSCRPTGFSFSLLLLAALMREAVLAALPGALPMEPSLATKIRAVLQAKGPAYHPEAAHRNPDGSPRYTNRLILETSPYLMQHAHNPVDWRPWGDEAFEEAKRLGRPVLLSCHSPEPRP